MIVHCKVHRSPEPTAKLFRAEKQAAAFIRGAGARFIRVRFVEGRIIVHYWPTERKVRA